jgi:hypothetical protein
MPVRTVRLTITTFDSVNLHDEGAFDALQKSIKSKGPDVVRLPTLTTREDASLSWNLQADSWCQKFNVWAKKNMSISLYKSMRIELITAVRTAFRKSNFNKIDRFIWDGTKAYDSDDVLNLDCVCAYFNVSFKE